MGGEDGEHLAATPQLVSGWPISALPCPPFGGTEPDAILGTDSAVQRCPRPCRGRVLEVAWMESEAPRMADPSVFLSYHSNEEKWAQRVCARLEEVSSVGLWPLGVEVDSGKPAHREAALGSARVAVLLVSKTSLVADDLHHFELPRLKARRREGDIEVVAFLLEPCADLSRSVLGDLPSRTLIGISPEATEPEVERLLGLLARWVAETLGHAATDRADGVGELDVESMFDELYAQHFPALVAFFGHRQLDPETSRDLAQKTMLQVYQGLRGFQSRASTRTWVLRIATHVWCNWVRDHRFTIKRGASETSLEGAREQGLEIAEGRGFWPASGSDPERLAVEKQAQERIHARISDLSSRQQVCMTRWLEGWSYQEMADEMGVSIQTVRASLHKAKKRISQELQQEFRGSASGPSFAGAGP